MFWIEKKKKSLAAEQIQTPAPNAAHSWGELRSRGIIEPIDRHQPRAPWPARATHHTGHVLNTACTSQESSTGTSCPFQKHRDPGKSWLGDSGVHLGLKIFADYGARSQEIQFQLNTREGTPLSVAVSLIDSHTGSFGILFQAGISLARCFWKKLGEEQGPTRALQPVTKPTEGDGGSNCTCSKSSHHPTRW